LKIIGYLHLYNMPRKSEIPQFVVEVGQAIRAIRKAKKMSIEEVAYKVGIDAQNLRKYELGKQEMKISMLNRISEALEVEISDITGSNNYI
jgi:transcriptional regulator with XRE-family HTH domain